MWVPERIGITEEDVAAFLSEFPKLMEQHMRDLGPGGFTHPQEYVGCLFGQLRKLSIEADEAVYLEAEAKKALGSLLGATITDSRYNLYVERCRKVLMAAAIGYLSAKLARDA